MEVRTHITQNMSCIKIKEVKRRKRFTRFIKIGTNYLAARLAYIPL